MKRYTRPMTALFAALGLLAMTVGTVAAHNPSHVDSGPDDPSCMGKVASANARNLPDMARDHEGPGMKNAAETHGNQTVQAFVKSRQDLCGIGPDEDPSAPSA